MSEKRCCVVGCDNPADGLDTMRCQEHWESWCDRQWWEQVRACLFATADLKNRKGESMTKEAQP